MAFPDSWETCVSSSFPPVPRSPLRSPLPALKKVLAGGLPTGSAETKAVRIAASLRPLILEHRNDAGILFYPLRELARHFRVSLRTASLAEMQLESEGLLVSIRGSHTEIPGTARYRSRSVKGVVGMPLWLFGARYSHLHKHLPYALGELLWKQNLVLETIPYSEVEDLKFDFSEHLLRHRMDFVVWLYPFRHNRQTILKLKDAGVRNLIIGHGVETTALPAHIITDPGAAYAKILSVWKQEHGIRRIIIPEGFEYNRARGQGFARMAENLGFRCQIVPCTSRLIPLLKFPSRSRSERAAVALLDEHATAEFTHCDPVAFARFAANNRVLFANNTINLPFIDDNVLTVERIGIDADKLARLVSQTIRQWRSGDMVQSPRRFVCSHDIAWRLRRYL
ncbi:MAG: hypothetical protein ABW223_11470 [Rariglobus sp.]